MNEATLQNRLCLLILPRNFYSFASTIARGLADLGYETVVANDEYPISTLGKIMSKLGLPLSQWITGRVLSRDFLDGKRYDLILVMKGRGLGKKLASRLSRHASQVVGYHFDSFRYDRGPARWRHCLPRVCTFDYRDAEEHHLPLVELFASLPAPPEPLPKKFGLSAIMRNHSQRLAYMDRVLEAVRPDKAFIYVFEANVFSFISNFVRQPLLYLKYRQHIHRTPLPYQDYVDAIAGSEFTVDYAHPRQTGITIRCFEALSVGTRIITNNPYVSKSPYFEGSSAFVFSDDEDAAALRTFVSQHGGQPAPLRRRDVRGFLLDLLAHRDTNGIGHDAGATGRKSTTA